MRVSYNQNYILFILLYFFYRFTGIRTLVEKKNCQVHVLYAVRFEHFHMMNNVCNSFAIYFLYRKKFVVKWVPGSQLSFNDISISFGRNFCTLIRSHSLYPFLYISHFCCCIVEFVPFTIFIQFANIMHIKYIELQKKKIIYFYCYYSGTLFIRHSINQRLNYPTLFFHFSLPALLLLLLTFVC